MAAGSPVSSSYDVRVRSMLPEAEARAWSERLAGRDFGEIAIDWTEALRASGTPGVEYVYLEVVRDGEPRALVIIHLLRGVDLAD